MKVINLIKNIILDVVIVFLIFVIIFSFLNKNKPTPIFNYYFFTVMSGSMQNELMVGDSIIVKKVDDYKIGDIVTYKSNNSYVTHRIVNIDNDIVTTKGDANEESDPSFNKKDILGKIVYKSKFLNFIVDNKLFIMLGVIILYLIDLIIQILRKKEDEINE